jgi:chromosome segregation protein
MLKALELIGFKSFAGKTRFEFPSGITAVVGPNGSGKSNIVDAVKWVLGEQSVKSLRGKEMADVIFNGSGTRRPMNSAEITLTFDNSAQLLDVDTPEVHITRRVYRSGEGEYLINRQPCRLRDIRDLLSGTGMGTQAYSIIEQGKVDVLLQASARERRVIFEEAAGISRFKAKKVEALRRLDRVEQNLLRLSDIVDEVDNRLRSVRAQAGKARRYREHTSRLQELRTQVGLVDWRRLTATLSRFEDQITTLGDQRDAAIAEAEASEARLLEAETRAGDLHEEIRAAEARISANRERIAGHESTIEHERERCRDLEQELAQHRRQVAAMSHRAGDLEQQLRETGKQVDDAEQQHRQVARTFAEGERFLTDLTARLDQVRSQSQQCRTTLMEKMRATAVLGNQISGLESRVVATAESQLRCDRRLAELGEQADRLHTEATSLERHRRALETSAAEWLEKLAAAEARADQLRTELEGRRSDLIRLRQRRSAVVERASVLDELVRRHEGLSPGVKEVLQKTREATDHRFCHVRGLVADLFDVSVEAAHLVEVALGEKAQHVAVAGGRDLLAYLQSEAAQFSGRVGFLWLDDAEMAAPPETLDLERRAGVLGRADRFVQTSAEYRPLARRLLSHIWIVEKLSDAVALAQAAGPGTGFVTLKGEALTPDGSLIVGPRQGAAGQISRRSELRALRQQVQELDGQIGEAEAFASTLESQIAEQRRKTAELAQRQRAADAEVVEHRHEITANHERLRQIQRQLEDTRKEQESVSRGHDEARESLEKCRLGLRQAESDVAETENLMAALGEQIDRLEADRAVRSRDTTEVKVSLAKSEERLRNLRARMQQFLENKEERLRAIEENQQQLRQCLQRLSLSRRKILQAESEVAELYLRKEEFEHQTLALIEHRETIQQDRSVLKAQAQRTRKQAHHLEEKIHAEQLKANEVRLERATLADRLREDYQIELAQLEHKPTEEEQHEREEVQNEIEELRRKINNLGNVNLEALEELEQLENRFETLSTQFKDLTSAKNSLQRIIEKINVDSRRLFSETLETVRGHFRSLFRDVFGGGQADIVVEADEDILECGIEIIARPPGKEPRNISLLSGGEKTMTCVALLLALFRSRPSPFCILDEVDAALDEANIGRFTNVLRDFLSMTQFIIVTHSKKTMTCADTIYGVTMQESGVSKPVSVRFEDVSEDGHIRIPPSEEATDEQADSAVDETQAA